MSEESNEEEEKQREEEQEEDERDEEDRKSAGGKALMRVPKRKGTRIDWSRVRKSVIGKGQG